jgi:long-chain acyl-CoA synthetase
MFDSEIAQRFHDTCRARAGDLAVLQLPDGGGVSFGDLYQQYEFTLGTFRRLRIGEGDCVASLLGNRAAFISLLVACLESRAALLPIGETTDAEAAAMIENAGARAVVTDRTLPLAITDQTAIDGNIAVRVVRRAGSRIALPPSVVIKLTSGSTELPKAAVATARALLADTASITTGMGIRSADVNLGIIPLSHAYALSNIVVPLITQGTAVALRGSFSPSQFVNDVVVSGATVFPGVPFMYDRLRHALGAAPLPPSLRLLVTAGARIDPETVRWFHERARRKIHSFYGASETGGITFDESDELSEPLHVGRALPNVDVGVLPEPGLNAGGRIYVRGPGLALGYAGAAGPQHGHAFQDGGFRTADVGHFNAAGQLVLTGRLSALVNVAGRKVDPAEVERVLRALPDVNDVRVLGIDAPQRGQELIAFILATNGGMTPLALRQRCAESLSPYKIPRRFIFVDAWPVDARGKVDRRALQTLALHS